MNMATLELCLALNAFFLAKIPDNERVNRLHIAFAMFLKQKK